MPHEIGTPHPPPSALTPWCDVDEEPRRPQKKGAHTPAETPLCLDLPPGREAWSDKKIIQGEGGQDWVLEGDWFGVKPICYNPIALTSTLGPAPDSSGECDRGPADRPDDPGDAGGHVTGVERDKPDRQGLEAFPNANVVVGTLTAEPGMDLQVGAGNGDFYNFETTPKIDPPFDFDESFQNWYSGRSSWEELLASTMPGEPGTAFSEAEGVRRTKILTESYTVTNNIRDKIVNFAGFTPTVDAFASETNKRFPKHWEDAFGEDWSSEILWMNPPFSMLSDVLDKICLEQARGILVVPEWPSQAWYHVLGAISVDWWEIPHDLPLFQTEGGVPLPQKNNWHTRAVVFDALAYNKFLQKPKTTGEEGGSDSLPPSYPWPNSGAQEDGRFSGHEGPSGKHPNRFRRRLWAQKMALHRKRSGQMKRKADSRRQRSGSEQGKRVPDEWHPPLSLPVLGVTPPNPTPPSEAAAEAAIQKKTVRDPVGWHPPLSRPPRAKKPCLANGPGRDMARKAIRAILKGREVTTGNIGAILGGPDMTGRGMGAILKTPPQMAALTVDLKDRNPPHPDASLQKDLEEETPPPPERAPSLEHVSVVPPYPPCMSQGTK